jgi:hypothetical protein
MPLNSNPDDEDQEIEIEDVNTPPQAAEPAQPQADVALPPTPSIAAPVVLQPMIDPFDPEIFFEPDEYGIPLPPGWFDRTMKRYPQARQIARAVLRAQHDQTLADEIPLPTWREANEGDEEADADADAEAEVKPEIAGEATGTTEPEEDDSDSKYFNMHTYYEALERRIKKWN